MARLVFATARATGDAVSPFGSAVRAAAVPSLLWLWLFFHLHYEWTFNAQYNYGWAVPFVGAFIFYERWLRRPPPGEPRTGSAWLNWLLVLLLLPLRVIEEANPDWRFVSWILALVAVAISLLTLLHIGGAAWLRHFGFAICFPLVAVPWPVQFENIVIQNLTRAVAFVAVEIAGWIGVGAYQIGNIIELHNGFVGVDEACSGVKTLQAAIMVALVLGELFRLRGAQRILLLLAGCAWVFACNVLRATALVIIAAEQGTSALEQWHDRIGLAVLVVGMGGLLVMGWLFRTREHESEPSTAAAGETRTAPASSGSRYSLPSPTIAIVWLVAVFVATELWYRSHESQLLTLPAWQTRWPGPESNAQPMPIADSARAILRYDEASSAAWEQPRGVRWWSFFARWEPQRAALQLVRSHSPEICLPAVGRKFTRELEPMIFETSATPLRFRVYEFEQNGRALFVFVCIQEDKSAAAIDSAAAAEWSARGRLLAAWRGQRNLGQRLLEIAVIGFEDFARARDAMAETVRNVVVAGPAITG